MRSQPIDPSTLPNVDFETWLLKFDKQGVCVSPDTKKELLARLRDIPETPVILFSHGWNNEFSDATALYCAFLQQLERHRQSHPSTSPKPLFVGVIWPSTWLSWDQGPEIAAIPIEGKEAPERLVREELAEGLADPAAREDLYRLLETPEITEDECARLASLVSQSIAGVAEKTAREGAEAAAPAAGDVLTALKALQPPASAKDDGDTLPEGGTIHDPASGDPQTAGLLRYLDPRVALRLASVYQMKDRSGTVGWNGISRLIEGILQSTTAPLHTVGHSFGCKVILSAIAAAELPVSRKVETVLLLQPAISHLSFAASIEGEETGGGYRSVPAKVARRILTTYSRYDIPLHDLFHLALVRGGDLGDVRIAGGETSAGDPPSKFAALGGYGPRDAGQTLFDFLPDPGQAFDIPQGSGLIGLDGTQQRHIKGHGDVATPITTWLLHLQLAG